MATGNTSPSWGVLAKSFAVLGFIVALAWWALHTLFGWLALAETLGTIDVAITTTMVTAVVSIITVVVGSVLKVWLEDRRRREEYLRDHRVEPYEQLISMFYGALESSMGGEPYTEKQMMHDALRFNKALTPWGYAAAIQKWNQWRLSTAGGKKANSRDMLYAMEAVLIQLRVDMGEKKGLQKGDLLRLFISDMDEDKTP